MELTELELKLLRLGLDPAAQTGGIQGCAIKLFASLRARGVSAQYFELTIKRANHLPAEPSPVPLKPDPGLNTVPFGKHKGKPFCEVPPRDLRSTLDWLRSKPDLTRKFGRLIEELEQFLYQ
jgi:hypothetical protein